MKNLIKEFAIIPLILVLIAIGYGSTSIVGCNNECVEASASCTEGGDECCENLDCVDGRCCVSTGNAMADEASEANCCSGRSNSDGLCCAGAGEDAPDNFSCCNGLTEHSGTCYACVETNGADPTGNNIPCCDPTNHRIVHREADGREFISCQTCPCGYESIGSPEVGELQRCREPCPDATLGFTPDTTIPGTCELCASIHDDDCHQVIVMTKGYCDAQDAPGAKCDVVNVQTRNEEDIEICAADRACESENFVTDNVSGDCDPRLLNPIQPGDIEHVRINIDPIYVQSNPNATQEICDKFCNE